MLKVVSVELVCPLATVGVTELFVFQDGLARMYLDNDKLPCLGETM